MDVEVLRNLPREALIEKVCRLRRSVDGTLNNGLLLRIVHLSDMLALWGDLQLESRTLTREGRRLHQQVAKLAETTRYFIIISTLSLVIFIS